MMGEVRGQPVVLVACSLERLSLPGFGPLVHHAVFARYLEALTSAFVCTPLLVPALKDSQGRFADYVVLADGLLLTGAASNVAPHLYGGRAVALDDELDECRDATTLPLVQAAIGAGLPMLGICRGMQEINVALGGTLRRSPRRPGCRDHHADRTVPFAERYRPAHLLQPSAGGLFHRALQERGLGAAGLMVNSLHGQSVDRLGNGLVIEATAEDGTVEAIRADGRSALALGVQWHPEWYQEAMPVNGVVFELFAEACQSRFKARQRAGSLRFGEEALHGQSDRLAI
jgi:putative glutamine amidotransferase